VRKYDDDDAPPSTLCAFWPEAEPPLEEEVRLAFLNAFPEATLVDELERDDGVLWGLVFRLPEVAGDVVITAEPRKGIDDDSVESALSDAAERAAAVGARHLLVVETPVEIARPTAAYRRQARMLEAACVPGFPAVYDENAAIVRSGRTMRDLARAETPPGSAALYAVHELTGEHGAWVHTHGLDRLGVPELELWAVDASDVAAAGELLRGAVDAILAGVEPDAAHVLTAGEGVEIRLLPVDDALKLFGERFAASRREHEEDEDGEHPGPRLVLAAKDRDEPPYDVFARVGEAAAFYKARTEADRRRRAARERFGVFGQLFAMRRKQGWRFHAQLGFERGAGPSSEHVWFEILELKPGRLRGVCLNEPADLDAVRKGEEGWFDLERLTDWIVVAPDGVYDPESAPAVLDREP
jgi:uncharacterized protein YegJ (DUF2314 family)